MKVVEAQVPTPGSGEVLVEVLAAGVSDFDAHVREGQSELEPVVAAFLERGPAVSGIDFAGRVASQGSTFNVGDRVFGYVHLLDGPRTHAQYVAVDESDMALLPEGVDPVAAAALPTSALTAIEIVEHVKPVATGMKVLVLGASGSVGGYVVQLARSLGARVVAAAPAAAAHAALAAGAHEVRSLDAPFEPSDSFDLIVDTPAKWSFRGALPSLASGGMYVTTQPQTDEEGFELAQAVTQSAGYLMMLDTTGERLAHLARLLEEGVLKPAVDSVHTWADIDHAFTRVLERGKSGRVVLDLRDVVA